MDTLTEELTMSPPRTSYARQIFEHYRDEIAAGRLRPGDKLPSTAEIAAAFRCSQQPVKVAIGLLRELGYVQGHQGLGVFVAEHPPKPDRPA